MLAIPVLCLDEHFDDNTSPCTKENCEHRKARDAHIDMLGILAHDAEKSFGIVRRYDIAS